MIGHAEEPAAIRLAVVTNIPAPYRVPVYNRLAHEPGIVLRALYAARSEADRQWDLPPFQHDHRFLEGRVHSRGGRFIHYNPGVWRELREFSPDVVLTTGYNPTHLIAWLYAMCSRRPHVVMTDGTDASERTLSWLHRSVRRLVFAGTRSFVVASQGGRRLLRDYGIDDARIHVSPLCVNGAVDWSTHLDNTRDIDLLFSGRLVDVKNAGFALDVAQGVSRQLQRPVRMAVLGNGPLADGLQARAREMHRDVEVLWPGNVSQSEVPGWFWRSRVFLFPTRWDPWGVVANEACTARVPVLVSPHAGVAGDLIRDGINGRVLPLDLQNWVEAATELLRDEAVHERMAAAAQDIVANYDFEHAAAGMAKATHQAANIGLTLP